MSSVVPRFLDAGEAALVVEFGTTADPELNDLVINLDRALRALDVAGIRETVPTYRSLMVHYDPLQIDRASLIRRIEAIDVSELRGARSSACWIIPCCYEPDFAEDLERVGELTGLGPDAVVALHAGATYRISMYGFAPGFCYLGGLPHSLAVSRRETPRPPHPENSILLGGGLTLISTFPMPTGWWIVGRTPERMFSQLRQPNIFAEVGDEVRFRPIGRAEFVELESRSVAGQLVSERMPG